MDELMTLEVRVFDDAATAVPSRTEVRLATAGLPEEPAAAIAAERLLVAIGACSERLKMEFARLPTKVGEHMRGTFSAEIQRTLRVLGSQ